jgi:rubrerythrin
MRTYIGLGWYLELKVKLTVSKTRENLESAFTGESKANRRYVAFAWKADQEHFPEIAKLFRAAAEAETVHAMNHLKALGEIKSTPKNLETAVSGETFEFMKMYPEYLQTAKQENDKQAAWSFDVANKVEQIHANLYGKAVQAQKSGKDLPSTDYYVCGVCGNTVEGSPPEICPICGSPKNKFRNIV